MGLAHQISTHASSHSRKIGASVRTHFDVDPMYSTRSMYKMHISLVPNTDQISAQHITAVSKVQKRRAQAHLGDLFPTFFSGCMISGAHSTCYHELLTVRMFIFEK